MPPPSRQREGRSAQNKAALTSAGDDDKYGGDGGEHFSDGSAENRNCRNANCNALIDIQALVPLASSKVKHHGHLQTSSPTSLFENHWPVKVRVDPSLL